MPSVDWKTRCLESEAREREQQKWKEGVIKLCDALFVLLGIRTHGEWRWFDMVPAVRDALEALRREVKEGD